jgi:hypothetical protein
MVRRERESTNQIARFGTPKLPIPAISNASPAEKQTPAQSLRGLFTDDRLCCGRRRRDRRLGPIVRARSFYTDRVTRFVTASSKFGNVKPIRIHARKIAAIPVRADELPRLSARRAGTCCAYGRTTGQKTPLCRSSSAKCPHPTSIRRAFTTPWMEVDAISFRRRDCCVRDHAGF